MKRIRLFHLLPLALTVCMQGPQDVEPQGGFVTEQPAMLTGIGPNASVKPLITVGDVLPNGYRFEALPDGIAVDPRGSSAFDVYVSHETSTVPLNDAADYDNAQLSRLVLQRGSGKVLDGSLVITSDANYQRFCSSFFAGEAEGFERPLLFLNEETDEFVNRTGIAWPPRPGAEQAGLVVAVDPDSGMYRSTYGMGRLNHENSVAVPGYGQAVVLTGDDTFSAPSAQLYLYLAADADAVWNDEGHLWAFRSDEPAVNDYGDVTPGMSVSGHFIPVPDEIADGDQTALEDWSNANDVFQLIRVEDLAYDRNQPNVVYIADTGEPRAIPDPATGRLRRGPSGTLGPYPNGRVFRLELDPADPTVVTGLSILIDGDALGAASAGMLELIHNPDNLETTPWSLMIQEDPGSQNSYAPGDLDGTTARIWSYDLASGRLTVVARVDQSLDPAANQGDWESSGIVDASALFGRGAFLVDVQAHTIAVESEVAPNGILLEREKGQLLLLRIPGS